MPRSSLIKGNGGIQRRNQVSEVGGQNFFAKIFLNVGVVNLNFSLLNNVFQRQKCLSYSLKLFCLAINS